MPRERFKNDREYEDWCRRQEWSHFQSRETTPKEAPGAAPQKMYSSRANDWLEYPCEFKRETDKAYLVDIDGEKIWFPKSQSELSEDKDCIFISEWIAQQKGLI